MLFTYIHHSLASLSVLFKHKSFSFVTWVCSCVLIFWLKHLYILPNLQRPALEVHVLWWKTDIYSWNLSEKVSLMYENSFLIPLLCNLKHSSLYFIHNSIKSSDPLQSSPCFLKLIPGVLGRSVNFKKPKGFLCRRPVFPDYLSVSCDYDLTDKKKSQVNRKDIRKKYWIF